MLFNSYGFIVFLPIVVLVYFFVAEKNKLFMAFGGKLLFLYGVECKVCTFTFGFNDNYICEWYFDSMAE